ncbi:MAG: hypothetical protein NTW06_01730 [Candidatus Falkowbacteria bacterium]|nr:hypothetical protein [Candidatus Falkowbacteria bacterium]
MGEMVMLKVIDIDTGKMSYKEFEEKRAGLTTDLTPAGWTLGEDIKDKEKRFHYLIFLQEHEI